MAQPDARRPSAKAHLRAFWHRVTGWGETIYNVSVGGTDFEDVYNSKSTTLNIPISTYWNSTNTTTYGSAKSYIPEIPWNESCASVLIANYVGGASGVNGAFTTFGTTGFCNTTTGEADYISAVGAAGGPSGCATGEGTDQSNYGVVDTACTGYAKPSWQSGIFGNPADGVRDIPDVSLFASSGVWGHFATICYSDTTNGGTSCSGAPSTWSGFGGTSVAAPAMASIQALVNEKWSLTKVGNPNMTYYSIASSEFGASGNSNCYSINQAVRRGLGTGCTFYDITQGDIDVDCIDNGTISTGCYLPSGTYGVLGTQVLNSATRTAAGSGYTSATCALGAPSNANSYKTPTNVTLWAGGTPATCSASVNPGTHRISSVTITNGGEGYAGGTSCTISGNGTGATCSASPTLTTAPAAYQPAYGATPGWDFATGIGSVNAYNLVFNSAW